MKFDQGGAQPKPLAPSLNELTQDELRRIVWEHIGVALLWVGASILLVTEGHVSVWSAMRGVGYLLVLECCLLGLSLIAKDPVLEVAGRSLAIVFVRLLPQIERIQNVLDERIHSVDFDRAAQKAFDEVFTRGGATTRDHLYANLHIFRSGEEWEAWTRRSVEKGILKQGGGRGGNNLAVAGIDADEAWKRWSAPSGRWRVHPRTGKLVEQ